MVEVKKHNKQTCTQEEEENLSEEKTYTYYNLTLASRKLITLLWVAAWCSG